VVDIDIDIEIEIEIEIDRNTFGSVFSLVNINQNS